MSERTKGPWRLEMVESWPFGVRVIASDGYEVLAQHSYCHCTGQKTLQDNLNGVGFDPDDQHDVREALKRQIDTAHLIAAAPDLYEACAILLELVRLKYGNLHADTNEIQAKARAALAKADGETNARH